MYTTLTPIDTQHLETLPIDQFFSVLFDAHCISALPQKMLAMLKNIYALDATAAELKLLCLYFSLLEDGNICIALDEATLIKKWGQKWQSAQNLANEQQTNTAPLPPIDETAFHAVIRAGISAIQKNPRLMQEVAADFSVHAPSLTTPFVSTSIDGIRWLFAQKYFIAKRTIETQIERLFPAEKQTTWSPEEITACRKEIQEATKNASRPVALNDEQAQAVVRGAKGENLFITGGPGRGKTTVVFFLLWKMFQSGQYDQHRIYLAAPSGKASDRVKESIFDELEKVTPRTEKEKEILSKIKNFSNDPYTIHRLLSFSPATGTFAHNKDDPFPNASIFVIDEASMIDIEIFSALLQAIPDKATVFILGDKDQLPSVQAGAVLGDLLAKKESSSVRLIKSNRYDDHSDIGRLADAFQKPTDDALNTLLAEKKWSPLENITFSAPFQKSDGQEKQSKKEFPLSFYQCTGTRKQERQKEIRQLAERWKNTYYLPFMRQYPLHALNKDDPELCGTLAALWKSANFARILCAERRGLCGVEEMNALMCSLLSPNKDKSAHFAGQLVIITQNQKMYNLYNGDCGLVVQFKDDPFLYLMLKKVSGGQEAEKSTAHKNGTIFRIGNFMFYPLYFIAEDALESAYAITIHKSQGSGYEAILVLLPEQIGHPLLNRQIVYTAITRTKGQTYLVATPQALKAARNNPIVRDTKITLT